jgi:hypothetical protein
MFQSKNVDIFRFVAKFKISNLMFLSKIEEMTDFSYLDILSKIMFFFLSQLATLDAQDKHNKNTA